MIGHCLPTILEGHCVFPWDQILKLYSETKVWDLINMQNVLNHFTDRSSPLTGRRRKKFFFIFSAFGPWLLLYCLKLWRHLWCICFIYICLSQKGSDLVWYFGFRPKFSVTSRLCISLDVIPNFWSQRQIKWLNVRVQVRRSWGGVVSEDHSRHEASNSLCSALHSGPSRTQKGRSCLNFRVHLHHNNSNYHRFTAIIHWPPPRVKNLKIFWCIVLLPACPCWRQPVHLV